MKRIEIITGVQYDANGNELTQEAVAETLIRVKTFLAGRYGGITVYSGTGSWCEPIAGLVVTRLVTEPNLTFVILGSLTVQDGVRIADYVRDQFGQTCVTLTITEAEGGLVYAGGRVEQI